MRLGLFGGTFDPIHNAHVALARRAAERFQLDRVLVIPNAIPPHKSSQTGAGYADRMAMVELAVRDEPLLVPSHLEEGKEKSYSILTIERVLAETEAGTQLFFLIGADAFDEIDTWFRWREVMKKVDFIVHGRPGYSYVVPTGARVHAMEEADMPASSTVIRRRLAAGESPEELDPAVLAYIREHGLYRIP